MHPVPAEEKQVEVEFPRTPAPAGLTTEGALDALECEQEGQAARLRVGPAGTSRATTALRKSGWSSTPTGRVR